MQGADQHWNRVYAEKSAADVSWYQSRPAQSLSYILEFAPDRSSSILDVGGGASTLVDSLIAHGYRDLTVLDISATALAQSQGRLGPNASAVAWIVSDVTHWRATRTWRVWHDRAVFHFLVEEADQN